MIEFRTDYKIKGYRKWQRSRIEVYHADGMLLEIFDSFWLPALGWSVTIIREVDA